MPRSLVVLLGAGMALSFLMLSSILAPDALASPANAIGEVELRAGPSLEAAVLAVVPAGAVLTIDGPPQGDYYPVTANGVAGWAAAAMLTITKDEPPAAGSAATDPAAPVESPPVDPGVPPADALVADTTAAATPAADPASAPPTVTATPLTPDAAAMDTAASTDPPPSATPGAADPAASASPVAGSAPTPAPGPTGPAQATTDLNLRAGPSEAAPVLFLVPAGSTVIQTGSAQDGFVSATYQGIAGWIAADYLAAPAAAASEAAPTTSPSDAEVRTPRPGSGVAFTTAELPLRAGPSANEPALALMPAGSRVTLTGVTENGFHRVDYRGAVGWVDAAYLNTPPDPTPTGDDGGRGGQSRPTYTREEIVRIIYDAADRYGQSRTDMLRVAECESNLDPYAVNPSGSYGLFQFIRSTWESTPYGDRDIFDPRANANAAGWMWSVGRRSEWVCQ